MLYINKITCAAAVGAIPFVLFGCSSANEAAAHRRHAAGVVDENGSDPSKDPPSATAIKGLIGDCFYKNYCAEDKRKGCSPDNGKNVKRDTDFIGKMFMMVQKEVRDALGGGAEGAKAAKDIFGSWSPGDDVPGPALKAVNNICNAKHVPGTSYWGPEDLAKIKAIQQYPARAALGKAILSNLRNADLPFDDKDIGQWSSGGPNLGAAGYIGEQLDASFGPGFTDRVLSNWKHGEDLPGPAVQLLMRWIQMKLAERQQQHSQRGGPRNYGDGI